MAKLADTQKTDGHLIELFICDELRKRGFVILEQNYTMGKLEVDIIAMERDILCFIEVKSRRHPILMSELDRVITPRQQEHMLYVSDNYCRRLKGLKYTSVRFDYILVLVPDGIKPTHVKHIRNAFVPTVR